MSHEDRRHQLRALQSMAAVSDEAVRWLAEHVEPVSSHAGEVLITEGATDRDCYFIVSGETEVVRGTSVLGVSGAGEPEGELALFLGMPRSATTTALSHVETLRLRADDYDHLRRENPALADDIRVNLCRHLARRFGVQMFAGVSAGEDD
jgi:CRP-like cAMP-binding protein